MEVFSTITSPAFSELVIVLERDETIDLLSDVGLFETLRRMNEVRPFTLVFLVKAEELYCRMTGVLEGLEDAILFATANGLLNFLDSRPVIRATGLRTPEWETWPRSFYCGLAALPQIPPLDPSGFFVS